MTRTRPRPAADPAEADDLDRGISVRRAAEIIGVDESYVRKLLRRGKLAGYRLEHGVRIWLSSVRAYQQRRPYARSAPSTGAAAGATAQSDTQQRKPRPGARYREAVAALQRLGVRFAP